eukprot:5301091-Pyramimonas_sp.AAC.1
MGHGLGQLTGSRPRRCCSSARQWAGRLRAARSRGPSVSLSGSALSRPGTDGLLGVGCGISRR